jgi:hypothetical protein
MLAKSEEQSRSMKAYTRKRKKTKERKKENNNDGVGKHCGVVGVLEMSGGGNGRELLRHLWWAVIQKFKARYPIGRQKDEGGLRAGDRVIVITGRSDQVGKTGIITTRKMSKMVEVQYYCCRTGTEQIVTVKKGRESVIGVGLDLDVSRDERGTLWVTTRDVKTGKSGTVSDEE